MSVRVTAGPDALIQAEIAQSWWRAHRPLAPEKFEEELEAAFELLAHSPEAGRPCPRKNFPNLRRLLLRGVRHHIYYVYFPEAEKVAILSIWSAVRGRRPRLKPPER